MLDALSAVPVPVCTRQILVSLFSSGEEEAKGEAKDWKWLQDLCHCAEKVAGAANPGFIYYL